jgi:formylglycine-generating enzyme required for sulfatase activity
MCFVVGLINLFKKEDLKMERRWKMKRIWLVIPAIFFVMGLQLPKVARAAGMPTEKQYNNSIGMKFVRIRPGSFMMGSAEGGDFDEKPAHKVNITRPFYMAVTEVTNAQYERFDPSHKSMRGKYDLSKDSNQAVIYVSWNEAARFCRWLSEKENLSYRLPTEAEWEYACRAGTTTKYYTGDELPEIYHKHQDREAFPKFVDLMVGKTPANLWGLYDMHGNVEEWCYDWYGPYVETEQTDPIGPIHWDFKVTRGGSHNTQVSYLRSANRMGTLPEDKHWLIGFRVIIGESPPAAKHIEFRTPALWGRDVKQKIHDWSDGPDPEKPYFEGPQNYVKIPEGSKGPLWSRHNHQPAITACPNGDLLAIWYSTTSEKGRNLMVAASRLRHGSKEWEPASPFWDAPDRNDHGSSLLWDRRNNTIYHFNGLSTSGTWGNLALVMRKSTNNGVSWSKARIIQPTHGYHHQVIAGPFITKEGYIVVPCDAVPGGSGGSAIHISRDGGNTWVDPGVGRAKPKFEAGKTGAWIAGIHTGCTQLRDGSLLAFGRGDSIDGKMPKSISTDMGNNWTYSASHFNGIGGGQRLVLLRLQEGPLFFASFADDTTMVDAAGQFRKGSGLFGALSFDEGETWPVRRLITDDGPAREVDGGGNTGKFTLSATTAEPKGYMACTQAPDGVIHLISSKQHYAFNIAWLKEPMPTVRE